MTWFGFGKKAKEEREAREREASRIKAEAEEEAKRREELRVQAEQEEKRKQEEAAAEEQQEHMRRFHAAMGKLAQEAVNVFKENPPATLSHYMGWMVALMDDGDKYPHLQPEFNRLSVPVALAMQSNDSPRKWFNSDIVCNISDKSEHHILMMKALGTCYTHEFIDVVTFNYLYTMFLFNNGKCQGNGWALERFGSNGWSNELFERTAKFLIAGVLEKEDESVKRALNDILGTGNNWAEIHDIENTVFKSGHQDAALFLGATKSNGEGQYLCYTANESLVAIAPPGSGKTQALVLPNLVRFPGAALVLDVKGECYAKTAGWRKSEVGPVLRFAPSDPDNSAHYNPMDMVSSDPREAWKDARLLADMLVVPKGRDRDDYFEQRGRDLITALILMVALRPQDDDRNLGSVLTMLYPSPDEFEEFLGRCEESSSEPLRRSGNMLAGMPDRQREGVYDSARRHMEIWQSNDLAEITQRSDWKPGELRAANTTLYLCVGLSEISTYASVLRVIIGQFIRAETQGDTEKLGSIPLTLFLDELPRLGYMAPIEEALDVGRGYGLRLWMFAQNFGQLSERYENAKGMIGNCGVELYMNPDADTARSIASRLGERTDVFTGTKKPLANAVELAGPDYRERIIALGRGCRPFRLEKAYAFNNPEVSGRLGLPIQ